MVEQMTDEVLSWIGLGAVAIAAVVLVVSVPLLIARKRAINMEILKDYGTIQNKKEKERG